MITLTNTPELEVCIVNPIERLSNVLDRLESVCSLSEEDVKSDSEPMVITDRVSIVIPVYNEENTIGLVVSRVASLPLNSEIVIVDDYSTDGTREILSKLEGVQGLKVVLKEQNEGKGAALRTGFEHATGEFVVVQDADLEYHPKDIPGLLVPLINDECDVAVSYTHLTLPTIYSV